jgi:hypothetical protein
VARRRPPAQRWSFRPCALGLEDRLLLSTYVVTNVNDSGAGSLRAAITAVNANQDNMIAFQIPGSGVHTIQPHSALPALTVPATIDGTTQPGYAGLPLIELDGSLAGATDGLDINGGSSMVEGLAINRFAMVGIALNSDGNSVQGDFIGTDPTGTLARGNHQDGVDVRGSNNTIGAADGSQSTVISGNGGNGIGIGSGTGNRVFNCAIGTDVYTSAALGNAGNGVSVGPSNNTIGGSLSTNGNVISANGGNGVLIGGGPVNHDLVAGNLIGTDGSGTASLGNQGSGVYINGAGSNTIGGPTPDAANVISGNGQDGVTIHNALPNVPANGNMVESNLIGTDITGSCPLGNGGYGVAIVGTASGNNIGGQAAVGNIISANARGGVELLGQIVMSRLQLPTNNQIIANFIGTDISGTFALGNGGDGIDINQANSNTIGGTAPGTGNLISGNVGTGITITGGPGGLGGQLGISNVVQGNAIGTDASGSYPLSNGGDGVRIVWNVHVGTPAAGSNQVGGTAAGAGNLIAFNGGDGVHVVAGVHNPIQEDTIYGSGNLGIELSNNGNDSQAPPTLTSATMNGGNLTVQGTFQGAASTTYSLDLFANDACNPSGYGEGQYYLGSTTVQTDSSGHVNFTITLPGVSVSPGQFLSATATAPNQDTSSFSACLLFGGTGPATSARPPLADAARAGVVVAPTPSSPAQVLVSKATVDQLFAQDAADLVVHAGQDQSDTATGLFLSPARAQPTDAAPVEALALGFDLVLD